MADIKDYTGLITSEHNQKPKYMAVVESICQPMVDGINFLADLPLDFDLEQAIGVQLDAVGEWVGISRHIRIPLVGVYFSFDIAGIGFDQGVWKGPFDPDTGLTTLDDETYRLFIKAKIGANHWDGTLEGSAAILNSIFDSSTHVFIEDHQDMSMTIGVSGKIPSPVFLALLSGGYIPIKPESVRVSISVVTTVDGTPLFGFDMNNQYVAGFDTGAWSRTL